VAGLADSHVDGVRIAGTFLVVSHLHVDIGKCISQKRYGEAWTGQALESKRDE
jgi:hypothetical protein